MSSFLAKLELDGESYTVLHCRYEFEKQIDSTNKPLSEVSGGKILLTLESTGKSNFIDWLLANNKTKDGTIIFYRRDMMSRLQEIKFEKAYCVKLSEEFDAVNNNPMKISLTLIAKSLKFNAVSFVNDWIFV
ncbi:MAG: hypothetical protein LBP34_05970 [Flavobacteriaceae bacterium]|jgi:hypothetical protein|nr:hypothetical protein [Flavobacteriaceae bacterium]